MDEESADEDAIVLRAVEVLSELDGDDELAHAQREVLVAVAQERERQQRRDELHARREAERSRVGQRAGEEAARVDGARRARAVQAARAEAERRAQARHEALRREQARREELRRARERTVPPAPKPEKRAVLVVSGSISPLDPAGLPELPPLTGADLSAWRTRAGLTQQAAAERLGIRQGTVSEAESRGLAVLGPALRQALARALGVARTE